MCYRHRLKCACISVFVGAASHAHPVEQLTNPFGGMPPEEAPGDEVYRRTQEWEGNLLNLQRTFSIQTTKDEAGEVRRVLELRTRSADGHVVCLGYPSFRLNARSLTISSHVGGCWNIEGNGNIQNDFGGSLDLGGSRYGPFACQLAGGRGSCTYTSVSTGKEHTFEITETEDSEVCFSNGLMADC